MVSRLSSFHLRGERGWPRAADKGVRRAGAGGLRWDKEHVSQTANALPWLGRSPLRTIGLSHTPTD